TRVCVAWAFVLVGSLASWLLSGRHRETSLLVVSILAYGWFLRVGALVIVAFVLAICALARSSLLLRYQVAISLALLIPVPIFRATSPSRPIADSIFFFGVIWAGLAYSAIYVLVEHRR